MPEVRDKLLTAGIEPTVSKSPEEFAAFIRAQAETRSEVIKAVGIRDSSKGRRSRGPM